MKLKWTLTCCVCFVLCVASNQAHAFNLTPVLGFSLSGGTVTPENGYKTASRSMIYGGGLLFGFKMSKKLSLQVGTLYMQRGFQKSMDDSTISTIGFKTLQLPLTFQYFVLDAVYLGIGGYYSYGFGNVSDVPSTGGGIEQTYSVAGYAAEDTGAVVSLGVKLELLPFLSILVDGRYLYGLKNINKVVGMTTTLQDLQVLCGIRFGI